MKARGSKSSAKQRREATPSRESEELDEVFSSVARYFALLAEPMRLRILHAICNDERSVSAIVAATGGTQTNVSRHLALMHHAGVVARRRAGSTVFYRLLDPEFAQICRTMCVRVAGRIEADEPLKQDLLDYAATSAAGPSQGARLPLGGTARGAPPTGGKRGSASEGR